MRNKHTVPGIPTARVCNAVANSYAVPGISDLCLEFKTMRFLHLLRKPAQSLAIAAVMVASTAQAETQPAPVISSPLAGAVILRSEQPDVTMQSLHVLRQLPLADIEAHPIVMVGKTRLDFQPMLENRRAPFNIAKSLREIPQAAQVIADKTTFVEIDQGIVVRSSLTYRIEPGTCSDGARRAMVAKAGVDCATRLNDSALAAAFANKNDAHYVADSAMRATALAAAKSQRAASAAQMAAHITALRTSLNDPAKRTQIDAKMGGGESARLASLSDEQLTMELINSAETKIEQTIFIPNGETPNARMSTSPMSPKNSNGGTAPIMLSTFPSGLSGLGGKNSTSAAPPIVNTERLLDTRIFLTGFTLGRQYEWEYRVETTIDWCPGPIDCEETYFGRAFAKFSLGFGLRLPIQIHGLYKHHLENGQETATVTANYEPIDAGADEYAKAGLPKEQIFHGQEIVAEAVAKAGVEFKLPIIGTKGPYFGFDYGQDLTEAFPAPFTKGQFRPPAPGELGFPALEGKFDDADMLLGVGNYGAFGAKVFPTVTAQLHSTSLKFKFHDLVNGTTTWLEHPGDELPLAIDPDDHSSHFTLGDPEYKLGFLVTPGLTGRLFIHLGLWSHDWDLTVLFPQLALDLPPGGVKFACHEGTSCSRVYNYSPTSQSETVGPKSATDALILQWRLKFESKWMPQCLDQQCKDHISGPLLSIVVFVGVNQKQLINSEYAAAKAYEAGGATVGQLLQFSADYQAKIQQGWQEAENLAAEQVELSKIRKAKQAADAAKLAALKAKQDADKAKQAADKAAKQAAYIASLPQAGDLPPAQGSLSTPVGGLPPTISETAPPVIIQRRVPNLTPAPESRAPASASEAAPARAPTPPVMIERRIPNLESPTATPRSIPSPAPEPAPPPVTQGRSGFPNFTFPTLAPPRPAPVVQKSTLCSFNSGPRAGQIQDYAPMAPIPVGSKCQDARGSFGTVVAP